MSDTFPNELSMRKNQFDLCDDGEIMGFSLPIGLYLKIISFGIIIGIISL